MPFDFQRKQIPEVIVIQSKSFPDDRGYFLESFKESEFFSNEIKAKFVQDNVSRSTKGVIRGLHYQKNPKAQAKLVTVISGEIFDVAVDIRKNSPTFGKWVAETLSDTNHKSLYIPEGFAHGFCVTSEQADVIYKVNNEYSAKDEAGIIWNDSVLGIKWPTNNPILAKKDSELPKLNEIDNNFIY